MTDETKSEAPASQPLDQMVKDLGPRLDEAKAKLKTVNENVKGFIRDNPGTALLGAVALGFLVGKLASRK